MKSGDVKSDIISHMKTHVDNSSRLYPETLTSNEDLYSADILIRKIKKHPKIFLRTSVFHWRNRKKLDTLRELPKNERMPYLLTHIVRPQFRVTITFDKTPILNQRVNKIINHIAQKGEFHSNRETYEKVVRQLRVLKKWNNAPTIRNTKPITHEKRREFREKMEEIFDFQEKETEKNMVGPFSDLNKRNKLKVTTIFETISAVLKLMTDMKKLDLDLSKNFNSKYKKINKQYSEIKKLPNSSRKREAIRLGLIHSVDNLVLDIFDYLETIN